MRNYKLLSFLVFIILSFCMSVFAQNIENKEQTFEEKQAEIEVRKVVKDFIEEMDEKKDLIKISHHLFANNFKENFAKDGDWLIDSESELTEKLTVEERFDISTSFFNTSYLYLMFFWSKGGGFGSDEYIPNFKDIFPSNIVEIAIKGRFLNAFILSDDSDENLTEPQNLSELRVFIEEIRLLENAIRNYSNEQSPNWIKEYKQNALKDKIREDYFNVSKCDGDSCKNSHQNTLIYHHDSFPFCFEIVESSGIYKIQNIFLKSN